MAHKTPTRLKSYTSARTDLLHLLPEPKISSRLPILDVGCSNGVTGLAAQELFGVDVIGIEADPTLAHEAKTRLTRVIEGDALEAIKVLRAERVEVGVVVFGDVLEHLVDPWSCVELVQQLMPGGGWIVTSIPNVAHVETMLGLLWGSWPMRQRGIHDDTHLRFFARRDLSNLLERDRSRVVKTTRTYRLTDHIGYRLSGSVTYRRLSRLAGRLWPNGFTFQFKILVRVDPLTPSESLDASVGRNQMLAAQ